MTTLIHSCSLYKQVCSSKIRLQDLIFISSVTSRERELAMDSFVLKHPRRVLCVLILILIEQLLSPRTYTSVTNVVRQQQCNATCS